MISARGAGQDLTAGPAPDAMAQRLERMRGESPEKIRTAAAEFEAVFVTQMFKVMRRTVPKGLLGGGFGGKVYQEMLDAEHAKVLATQNGGLGLGALIARELGGQAAANARIAPEGSTGQGGVPVSSAPWERGALGGALGAGGLDLGALDRSQDNNWFLLAPLGANYNNNNYHDKQCWPAPGRVTSGFGVRRDPLSGAAKFHSGIDLATPSGTPVRAVADGRVVESGRRGGYGNVVVVDHGGGVTSLYAHNAELLRPVGARVEAGAPLALSGSTGRSTGPHVHFEVRKGGVPVDPRAFLQGER